MEKDLKNKTYAQLAELVTQYDGKPYWTDYLFTFIHQKHAKELHDISPLPKSFRQQLIENGFSISRLSVLKTQSDPDGTMKFLFAIPDGNCIEAVRLIDDNRITLCISTQVGCRMGCRFCATGQLQFKRNLTAAEIIDQVYTIESAHGHAHNLVYMGMGEPLDNYDQVMRSLMILHDTKGRNLGMRHITVSTCGLVNPIVKLAEETLQPRLAISLHAANEKTRNQIMHIARTEPLDRLLQAIRQYQHQTGRRVTFEYCMMDGINDSLIDAHRLIMLLRDLKVNVNLIELNDFPGCPYQPSPPAHIKKFAERLDRAGIETVIRFKRGRSIHAACGQLGAEQMKST